MKSLKRNLNLLNLNIFCVCCRLMHQFSWLRTNGPIFVVGCGHSGTSIMLAMLDMHPNIYAVPDETRLLRKGFFLKNLLKVLRWNKAALAAGKSRWAEKTPTHIRVLPLLFSTFPDAKVILLLRDGRDVAVSMKKRREDGFSWGVRRWLRDNRLGEPFWSHPRVSVIRYEELVTQPDETARKICAFLEEPFCEEMVRPESKKREWYDPNTVQPVKREDHAAFRNWQINQPLFNGSGKWKKEMTAEERCHFKEFANEKLVEYGYESGLDW